MKRSTVGIAAMLALAACETPTQSALEARVAVLTNERDEDAKLAEHAASTRAPELASLGVWDPSTDNGHVLLAASRAAGACARAGIRRDGPTPIVTLDGTGSPAESVACLDRFAAVEPAMVLRTLRVGEHDWTAELILRDPAPASSASAATPPPGGFELPRTARLRVVVAKLEAQIAEYDKLLGDARARRLVGEPDRLESAHHVWDAGWAGPGAPLASGSMRFENGAARLDGPLASGVDAAGLATIASSRQLEIASVDASSASLIAKEP